MDARAYITDELWQAILGNPDLILDQMSWNPIVLSHKRYDMVLHVVTVADGAARFYTTDNNQARYENVEEAIDIDKKLQNAYNGHPNHKIIKNVLLKDFQYKMNRVLEEVMTCVELTEGATDLSPFKYLLLDSSKPVLS